LRGCAAVFYGRAVDCGLVHDRFEIGCQRLVASRAQPFEIFFFLRESGLAARFFFYIMSDFGVQNQNPVAQAVGALIAPVLADLGYELVEVQFKREQHGQILRIVIYHESGIGIDDCARVSREVAHLLEVEDLIDQAYNLEVTSPGLDWRFRNERDFARFKGKKVRIVLLDQPEAVIGLIGEVEDDRVAIESQGDRKLIPFASIKKAKLVIEF
jgi:ribosome maturation factor RimP